MMRGPCSEGNGGTVLDFFAEKEKNKIKKDLQYFDECGQEVSVTINHQKAFYQNSVANIPFSDQEERLKNALKLNHREKSLEVLHRAAQDVQEDDWGINRVKYAALLEALSDRFILCKNERGVTDDLETG